MRPRKTVTGDGNGGGAHASDHIYINTAAAAARRDTRRRVVTARPGLTLPKTTTDDGWRFGGDGDEPAAAVVATFRSLPFPSFAPVLLLLSASLSHLARADDEHTFLLQLDERLARLVRLRLAHAPQP